MRHVNQLVILAKALAEEIKTLKAELHGKNENQIAFNKDGINFYDAVERYEIELIRSALNQCGGNQAQAAKLLHLKSTTLNAKMKHYGLNPVRRGAFIEGQFVARRVRQRVRWSKKLAADERG
jgi:DNA-binding NtrC family response regulator